MTRLEEFHLDFTQTIISDADSRGLMRTQAFVEKACEILSEAGDLSADFAAAEYIKDQAEAYGYDYDGKNDTLTLLGVLFFQEEEIRTLTKALLASKFTKLKNFFRACAGGIYSQLEETSDAYAMAFNIYKYLHQQKAVKVRMLLVSDGRLTKNTEVLPAETIYEVPIEFQIIDIEYLHDIYLTEIGDASFEIPISLPFLKVNGGGDSYQSYLAVITGDQLVSIYEAHNRRLFEQNVRTFLQFKGGVNKGLRNTIQDNPEMFFAYNNGITATAAAVETGSDVHIRVIKNLQIVNGGQTVSAVYAAHKKGADVSKVAVQMKLSVVKDPGQHDEFVSKVAEYANTQNKINSSDFFSNHPFHKEIKVFSANTFAPAVNGSQRRTRWYYERVRGEYLNSQAYLEPSDKKKFQQDYPKGQVIDKTLLSKTENVWLCVPHIVAKGAQYSFKEYSDYIIKQTEKDPLFVNEAFFKHAAARVILFRTVEKLITAAAWYDGGYRAQTAAYTISKLSDFLTEKGYRLNFDLIWETQAVPQTLIWLLEEISKKVYDSIIRPVEGRANPAQYAKTKECWSNIQKIELSFNSWHPALFIKDSRPAPAEPAPSAGNNIDVKAFVSKKKTSDWMQLADSYDDDPSQPLSSRQRTILLKMALGQIKDPTEAECQVLYDLYIALSKL